MLNYIWGGFMLAGILYGILTNNMEEITNSVIRGGRDAVSLAITMLGVVAIWTGIMRIAQKGGLIQGLSKSLNGILKFLFPSVPENHPAREYIATNFAANFLGLGWAATPAGLQAMKELQKLNKHKKSASNAMCMFLIINMSSVQLVSINILAYRAEYGSLNPTEILGASLIATIVSTIVGIFYGKVMERWYKQP